MDRRDFLQSLAAVFGVGITTPEALIPGSGRPQALPVTPPPSKDIPQAFEVPRVLRIRQDDFSS